MRWLVSLPMAGSPRKAREAVDLLTPAARAICARVGRATSCSTWSEPEALFAMSATPAKMGDRETDRPDMVCSGTYAIGCVNYNIAESSCQGVFKDSLFA